MKKLFLLTVLSLLSVASYGKTQEQRIFKAAPQALDAKPVDAKSRKLERYMHIYGDQLVFEIRGRDGQSSEYMAIDRTELGGNESPKISISCGGLESCLAAQRKGRASKQGKKATEKTSVESTVIPIEGIYGVYSLPSGPYVVIIRQSEPALAFNSKPHGVKIERATQLEIVEIQSNSNLRRQSPLVHRREAKALEMLVQALSTHDFYFSRLHDQQFHLAQHASSRDELQSAREVASLYDVTLTLQRMDELREMRRKQQQQQEEEEEEGGDAEAVASVTVQPALWRDSDTRFFWNLLVVDVLEKAGAHNWILPVTSAFIGQFQTTLPGDEKCSVALVSRRGWRRQGKRLIVRGIDDKGDVANFVETEQMAFSADGCDVTSHVQIRGSIPLFWGHPNHIRYRAPLTIENDEHRNRDALRRHISELHEKYTGQVLIINLIDKKQDQGRLGNMLKDILEKEAASTSSKESVRHIWFDFHRECKRKRGGHKSLQKLESQCHRDVKDHGFFARQNFHHGIKESVAASAAGVGTGAMGIIPPPLRQSGVVRTNCIDCLDRTNVVQTLLARGVLLKQLNYLMQRQGRETRRRQQLDTMKEGEESLEEEAEQGEKTGVTNVDVIDDDDDDDDHGGGEGEEGEEEEGIKREEGSPSASLEALSDVAERRYRYLWGDNADAISLLYAGTSALKGDYTRTGRRTKVGLMKDGLNSATRYYVNHFLDPLRQQAIDLLLSGKHTAPSSSLHEIRYTRNGEEDKSDIEPRDRQTAATDTSRPSTSLYVFFALHCAAMAFVVATVFSN